MNKMLIARKCINGYIVKVETTYLVDTEDDVKKIARYEGLFVKLEISDESKIVAE